MSGDEMSRRKFIALASAATAAGYFEVKTFTARAMMRGGGGSGMGGGGVVSIIDPPAGGPFVNPAEAPKIDGVYQLTASQSKVRVNGTNATLLTYNGSLPGPLLRARKGETLRIAFKNALPATTSTNFLGHLRNITNLHTHGLHVTPREPGDCMTVQLKPGGSYLYEYDLGKEVAGHINFYHPHVHGIVAEQYWGGMAGPLIIEDDLPALAAFGTPKVMLIKDISLSGGAPTAYTTTSDYMRGKEGNLVLLNGKVNPVLTIQPGEVQRWQIINACNARFLKLSLQQHSLHLIGTDGGLLDKPYPLDQILLSPGERIDVLVQGNETEGTFKLLSLPYDRGMNTLQQVTLLTLNCSGASAGGSIPDVIDRSAQRLTVDTSQLPRRQMTLSMMMGKGYINGQSFVDMDHCYSVMSDLGGYEVWEISNNSGMDHPFHQHVNSCQVLSISGGDPAYASLYRSIPARKDVVVVPKMGTVTLLVPVTDYDGMAMFHCHIIEHEDIGMMGMWHLMANMGGAMS